MFYGIFLKLSNEHYYKNYILEFIEFSRLKSDYESFLLTGIPPSGIYLGESGCGNDIEFFIDFSVSEIHFTLTDDKNGFYP